ncbi:hypothetical protein SBA7_480002 [Candidatus Sulfotelmatobacter sp. SbA7]|nr:hypothetical protein SBA7_480002 [Candidatus Sulfotelmatobacter sp. SbA7]
MAVPGCLPRGQKTLRESAEHKWIVCLLSSKSPPHEDTDMGYQCISFLGHSHAPASIIWEPALPEAASLQPHMIGKILDIRQIT